jgi:dihydrodipicolinate synthase/N-acetylneuraminate lyase
MEINDRERVLEAALAACIGRVPVVSGTHHYSTQYTIKFSKHAEHAGANALLIVPSYYKAPMPS